MREIHVQDYFNEKRFLKLEVHQEDPPLLGLIGSSVVDGNAQQRTSGAKPLISYDFN